MVSLMSGMGCLTLHGRFVKYFEHFNILCHILTYPIQLNCSCLCISLVELLGSMVSCVVNFVGQDLHYPLYQLILPRISPFNLGDAEDPSTWLSDPVPVGMSSGLWSW